MKKALVVVGMVVGAVLATGAVRADKSRPLRTAANECVGCVHECAVAAKHCILGARHARNECYRKCMAGFRTALIDCDALPAGDEKEACQKAARDTLSNCKTDCDDTFTETTTDCTELAEEDCLKDCVQGPGGNITAARCADLCPVCL